MAEGRFIDLKSQDIKQIDEILLRYVSPNNRDSARGETEDPSCLTNHELT